MPGLVTHTLDGYQETEGNTQLRTFQNHFFMHLNLVSTEPSHVYNSLVMNHFVFGKATRADKKIDQTGPNQKNIVNNLLLFKEMIASEKKGKLLKPLYSSAIALLSHLV